MTPHSFSRLLFLESAGRTRSSPTKPTRIWFHVGSSDGDARRRTPSIYVTTCNFSIFFFFFKGEMFTSLATVVFLSWLFGSLSVGLPAIFDAATYKNRREEQKALGTVSHSCTELLFLLDPPPPPPPL